MCRIASIKCMTLILAYLNVLFVASMAAHEDYPCDPFDDNGSEELAAPITTASPSPFFQPLWDTSSTSAEFAPGNTRAEPEPNIPAPFMKNSTRVPTKTNIIPSILMTQAMTSIDIMVPPTETFTECDPTMTPTDAPPLLLVTNTDSMTITATPSEEATDLPTTIVENTMTIFPQPTMKDAPDSMAEASKGNTQNSTIISANSTEPIFTSPSSGFSLPFSTIAAIAIGSVAVLGSIVLIVCFIRCNARRAAFSSVDAKAASKDNSTRGGMRYSINSAKAYPWSHNYGVTMERGGIATGAVMHGTAATGGLSAGIAAMGPNSLSASTPPNPKAPSPLLYKITRPESLQTTRTSSSTGHSRPDSVGRYSPSAVQNQVPSHLDQLHQEQQQVMDDIESSRRNMPSWLKSPTWVQNVVGNESNSQTRVQIQNNDELRKLWTIE